MGAERPWKSFARIALIALVALMCAWQVVRAQGTTSDHQTPKDRQVHNDVATTLVDDSSKPATQERAPAPLPRLDLQALLRDVVVKSTPNGDVVRVKTDNGTIELTPEQYVRALAETKAQVKSGGTVYRLLNISRPASFWWILVGLGGQVMFTFRMLLQWWASEKHKRVVVPVGFWWGSLAGGAMLFAYFCWRKDVVGIIGQSTGVFIYARNLVLIYRGKKIETEGARTLDTKDDADDDEHLVSMRAT
jgi:lipid-A-disaccharide synthase-like uncharacterized protein